MIAESLSRTITALLACSALAGAGLPETALAAPVPDTPAIDGHDNAHAAAGEEPAEIVVAGHPPVDFSLLASSATLEGDQLVAEMRGQVGEMLAKLPGVSATSFAPGVSRPVLRGFDGDRIRVLVDGIGSVDASSVSADHAVVFDPLTVDHIDVVHGPAVLLFGGQAIGGAVNALDKRIPRKVPLAIEVTALAGFGSAAEERTLGAAIDVPVADRLAVHFDANWRKSGDVRVGGPVNAPALRQELFADADEHRADGEAAEAAELEAIARLTGRVPNSAARSHTLGAGIAFIDAGGNLGLSVQRYDSRYGVPIRPGTAHDSLPVSIDLVQTRVDLRAALNFAGLFESLQLRGAYGDYSHVELEGTEAGTRFDGNGYEMRADLIQRNNGGWRGRSGIEVMHRKLAIDGLEAFAPDYMVGRFGVFTLQSIELGKGIEAELAGRYEHATVRSNPVAFRRTFNLWSGAAGLSWVPAEGWKLGANIIRGARAPAPEELLSDGLHAATQAYETGDPTFTAETSTGYEVYLRYNRGPISLSLTGYHSEFPRFIAARPTGAEIDGLPVFRYAQLPARFQGFEMAAEFEALQWDNGTLTLDMSADYTHAQLKGTGPVPRIPPLRLRGGAEIRQGALRLGGEVEWNQAQNRIAEFEASVAGFTMVNLHADWHPLGEDGPITLLFAANNVLNVNARRASSFTREFVPLAGRDLRVTVKISF